ncbi:hypothetical protein [Vibrio agarivorans]|uniref:TraG N-terminal Proteobacteria domain-containing protein n=1 Tax=Vibrio agarivorans TaxID=153622 RepID=A0ABT7Y786_9VIBR|nr:hypothetical protein [Vibrio agarivorans]MDN2483914.1 hypothetical protein [Vibrio agarivorans]
MALKLVEKEFIPMFLVLLVASIPMKTTNMPTVSYKAYSCAGTPSLITGAESVSELKPNTNFSDHFGNDNMTPLLGLVHQGATVLNGVFTAKLNCDAGVNRHEVASSFANASISNRGFVQAILGFDGQCYQEGLTRFNNAMETGSSTTDFVNNNDYYITSSVMLQSYDGSITSPTQRTINFIKPPTWNTHIGGDDVNTCTEAAYAVENAIKSHLQTYAPGLYGQDYDTWIGDIRRVSNFSDPNRMTHDYMAERELIGAVYYNAVNGRARSSFEAAAATNVNDVQEQYRSKIYPGNAYNAGSQKTQSYGYHVQQAQTIHENNEAVSKLVYFGGVWGNFVKSLEAMSYVRIAPSLVSVAQGLIHCLIPIILLLSGYSPRVLLSICLAYFSVSCIPFFLNLGIIFDSKLTAIVEEYNDFIPIATDTASTIINFAGTVSMVFICTTWLMLFQMLGVRITSMMDAAGAVGRGAEQAGQIAIIKSMQVTDKGMKQGYNALAGKGGDENKELIATRIKGIAERSVKDVMNTVGK